MSGNAIYANVVGCLVANLNGSGSAISVTSSSDAIYGNGNGCLHRQTAHEGVLSGVAHFAHLGGMLFGWLLIRYWRGQPPFGRRKKPPPKFRIVG